MTWIVVLLVLLVAATILFRCSGAPLPLLDPGLSLETPQIVPTGTETEAAAPFPSGPGADAPLAFTNLNGVGVWIRFADGSIWHAYEEKIAERWMAWSPDGRRLAFRAEIYPPTLPRSFALLVADAGERQLDKVTDFLPGLGRPAWRLIPGEMEIYAASPRGIVRRRYPSDLPAPPGPPLPLVYERDGEIWVEADGQAAWQLSLGGGYAPQISPDGGRVLYQWGDHIFVASLAEGVPAAPRRPLTAGIFPVWSPDGARIAFARMTDDGHDEEIECDLYYLDLARPDRPPRQLTFTPKEIEHEISWQDPGEIVYSVRHGGGIRRARLN